MLIARYRWRIAYIRCRISRKRCRISNLRCRTQIWRDPAEFKHCRKVKPIWILLKQETVSGSGISWNICKSAYLQADNHTNTPPLSFLQARSPSCRPTNSVKASKANKNNNKEVIQVITRQSQIFTDPSTDYTRMLCCPLVGQSV